jgi:hypothetical protein
MRELICNTGSRRMEILEPNVRWAWGLRPRGIGMLAVMLGVDRGTK